jgi:antitoxin HicB
VGHNRVLRLAPWIGRRRELKISNVKLAKQFGCDEKDVRRLLDPRHSSRITAMQAVLAALGKRIVSAVENAA